jgi:hypothetical protein
MIERIRLPPRRSINRAGALPVGSYALRNSLPVCCLYHRLHNGVCGDGNTGPLIHRDGAARSPWNLFWQVTSQPYGPGLTAWTLAAGLDCKVLSLDSVSVASKILTRLLLTFRGVAPSDCLYERRASSPKAGSEEREVVNSASRPTSKAKCPRRRAITVLQVGCSLVTLVTQSTHSYTSGKLVCVRFKAGSPECYCKGGRGLES